MEIMDNIVKTAALILTVVFIGILAASLLCPKRKRRIIVAEKYIAEHKGLNQTRSREIVTENYIIQCRFTDSKDPDKIHTLNCRRKTIYELLHTGKAYTVEVKMFEIVKIHEN